MDGMYTPGIEAFWYTLVSIPTRVRSIQCGRRSRTSRIRGNTYALRYDAQNPVPGPAPAIATLARWRTGAGDADHRISDGTYAAPGPGRALDRWPPVSPRTPK